MAGTVAHHQPVAAVVNLIGAGVDVSGHLGVQGCGQHLAGTIANDLIQQ